MSADIRIQVRGLSKRYLIGAGPSISRPHMTDLMKRGLQRLLGDRQRAAAPAQHQDFWALRDINFDLRQGERLGIIGRNGAGKSTLLKILARVIYPTAGEVRIRGRVTALLEVGTGFNAALSGRENVFLSASVYGLSRREIAERFDQIVEFSGIGDFIEEPVKSYSNGMRARLGFAVAAHLDPDILVLDEVLAVGDMNFVQKCLRKVEGLTSGGRTVVFVSHSISDVVKFCDRALWLEQGGVVMQGPVKQVAEAYASSMLGLKAEARNDAPAEVSSPDAVPPTKAGDDSPAAEILLFRLIDRQERPKATFVRQEPVLVHVRFRALRGDLPLITSVHVHQEGIHVFSTHPEQTMRPEIGGVYDAVVEIPPLLLNRGVYDFSCAVVTPVRPILRHSKLDMAINCSVFDHLSEKDVFSGEYRGIVRPVLSWQVRRHESSGGRGV